MDLSHKTGISQGYLARLERGTRRGSIAVYARLAHALGVPIQEILPLDDALEQEAHDVYES
ncbi:hypothetical protein TPY_2776 [Sulfobacillus acidophilus TPY]|nr:hypothetical protein TPY_2776 [Sulfobacillus acidophilus TPY]